MDRIIGRVQEYNVKGTVYDPGNISVNMRIAMKGDKGEPGEDFGGQWTEVGFAPHSSTLDIMSVESDKILCDLGTTDAVLDELGTGTGVEVKLIWFRMDATGSVNVRTSPLGSTGFYLIGQTDLSPKTYSGDVDPEIVLMAVNVTGEQWILINISSGITTALQSQVTGIEEDISDLTDSVNSAGSSESEIPFVQDVDGVKSFGYSDALKWDGKSLLLGVNSNIGIGANVFKNQTDGGNNVGIGGEVFAALIEGYASVGIGQNALTSATYSEANTAIGSQALQNLFDTNNNTALGYNAGAQDAAFNILTNPENSLFLGVNTRSKALGQTNEIVIGYNAIGNGSNTFTHGNTDITHHYLSGRVYQENLGGSTFFGHEAGKNDDLSSRNNVFIGYQAGYSNTTGYNNTVSGYQALNHNTTGYNNTASGYQALYSNTTGYNNSAQGSYSLFSNTTGYNNSAQGYRSLFSNTTGSGNSAQGAASLYSNTTGSYNSAQGSRSLYYNTTGSGNSAVGYQAGRYIADGSTGRTTGSNGLYLGYNTKASANGTDNEIVIGASAIGNGSNTFTHGNTSILNHYFTGKLNLTSLNTAPSSAADTGTAGEIRFAADAIYLCTAANTWVKAVLSTW